MKLSQTLRKNGILVIPLLVVVLFFYKTIFFGQIPFPGDLLVGNYEPYKSLSIGGFVPGSIPHKAQGPDVIKQLIPWKKLTVESFKSGHIPFWDPYSFSGNPLLANFQSGVFIPANIIFFIFDFGKAWSLYIFLIPVFASYFTYLFLRRLGLSPPSCAFGGIVFAFSSYMTVWMEYGNIGYAFIFLPLILYFADKLLEKITVKNFLGIVIAALFSLLAGYIQGVFYIYAITAVYFFVKGIANKKINFAKAAIFVSALVLPVVIASFQLLPTLELFGNSSRGNYSLNQIQKMLNPLYYLITIMVPDYFGNPAGRNYWIEGTYIERVSYFGLIPFSLAAIAVFTLFKKAEVKIFAFLFIVTLILATDIFITRFFYLLPIPILSTTVVTRILSITTFSGCILAAFGLDFILARKFDKKIVIILGLILIFLTGLFGFTIIESRVSHIPEFVAGMSVAARNLILPLASFTAFIICLFLFYKLRNNKRFEKTAATVFIAIVFIISFVDLYYYFNKITPFAPEQYLYPNTPVVSYLKKEGGIDRFWGYGIAYVESNFASFEDIYSTEGNDPLHIKEYTELVSASENGQIPDILPRPDANIAKGFGVEDLANNPYRQKVLNITGVKYLLNKNETLPGDFDPDYTTFPDTRYKLIWQEAPWQIYENLQTVPRVFVTNKYIVIKNKKIAVKTLLSKEFDERRQVLLAEDPKISGGELASSSKVINYSPEKVTIKTKSSKSALLFLSDTYYPGWVATVNGRVAKIFRADYAFRAVKIPKGVSTVVFEFKPKTFVNGLYVGILGIIALCFATYYINKKYEN